MHRYLRLTVGGRAIDIDAEIAGAAWDGSSSLPLICGEGEDHEAGPQPDEELADLIREHCDPRARGPFEQAVAEAGKP